MSNSMSDSGYRTYDNHPLVTDGLNASLRFVSRDLSGNLLFGSVFALRDVTGNNVLTATSDSVGNVLFNNIPQGRFLLKEITPAPNSLPFNFSASVFVDDLNRVFVNGQPIPNDFIEFDFATGGVINNINMASFRNHMSLRTNPALRNSVPRNNAALALKNNLNLSNELNQINGAALLRNFTAGAGVLNVRLVDADNNLLGGGVFSLRNLATGKIVRLITNNSNMMQFGNLIPGQYVLTEEAMPSEFIPSRTSINVLVDANGQVIVDNQTVTAENPLIFLSIPLNDTTLYS